MTTYAYRKIYTSNSYYTSFPNPTVGEVITFDPNANPLDYAQNTYGNVGIFLAGVNGYPEFLEGDTLIVVSYDPNDLTSVGDANLLFVSKCTVEYVATNGFDATFKGYFDLTQLTSNRAYMWALTFQDYDDVIQYINTQQDMSFWVSYCRHSDYDTFAPFIVDQEWIYYWATQFDDANFFAKLTDQSLLLSYALFFPDRESTVKPLITDPYWQDIWNLNFPDDPFIQPSQTPDVTPTASVTQTADSTLTPTPTLSNTPTLTATPTA